MIKRGLIGSSSSRLWWSCMGTNKPVLSPQVCLTSEQHEVSQQLKIIYRAMELVFIKQNNTLFFIIGEFSFWTSCCQKEKQYNLPILIHPQCHLGNSPIPSVPQFSPMGKNNLSTRFSRFSAQRNLTARSPQRPTNTFFCMSCWWNSLIWHL